MRKIITVKVSYDTVINFWIHKSSLLSDATFFFSLLNSAHPIIFLPSVVYITYSSFHDFPIQRIFASLVKNISVSRGLFFRINGLALHYTNLFRTPTGRIFRAQAAKYPRCIRGGISREIHPSRFCIP